MEVKGKIGEELSEVEWEMLGARPGRSTSGRGSFGSRDFRGRPRLRRGASLTMSSGSKGRGTEV